ncbi:MAG: hypothetical protein J2P23_13970 [Microlunatus sp.]|nr:hypothetical protein [Microlunatus sp.]
MDWQCTEFRRIAAALPEAAVQLHGSTARPEQLDGWSDLDLRLVTDEPVPVAVLGADLWAYEDVRTPGTEVCRMVLADGRRIDVAITGAGRIGGLRPAPDNDVRFLAALAAAKLGRGDKLIGGHLALEVLRACLVVAMQLRDRDLGTTVHRTGGDRDRYADRVFGVAAVPPAITPRPNIVERAVELYAGWRCELDPDYVPDWRPLARLIDRGLQSAGPSPGSGSGSGPGLR